MPDSKLWQCLTLVAIVAVGVALIFAVDYLRNRHDRNRKHRA